MPHKIENQTTAKLPRRTTDQIENVIDSLPREHTRGIERIRLVDSINDPRLRVQTKTALPGLYHPRQGTQPAWIEIAIDALLPRPASYFKRLMPLLSFKGNLAAILISLVGQHYYLTLRHSVKKGQIEPAVRAYTEKHLKMWGERQHSLRARLFKPFQPTLERWAKNLQRRASKQPKKGQK